MHVTPLAYVAAIYGREFAVIRPENEIILEEG
jgi:hypothetical protein